MGYKTSGRSKNRRAGGRQKAVKGRRSLLEEGQETGWCLAGRGICAKFSRDFAEGRCVQ